MPSECGKCSSRKSSSETFPASSTEPCPSESVAHSPTPSAVRMAARLVGAVRKAVAACDWWCSVKRIRDARTPSCEEMIPLTHSLPPSVFFIAWGKLRLEPRRLQTPLDGREWKGGVVLAPREPLLLHGADGHAVDEQRGRGVVIMGGDAEDAHQYWLFSGGAARARENPSGSRRAARFARSAKGGSSRKYCRASISVPSTPA